jgi:hypothetical protein
VKTAFLLSVVVLLISCDNGNALPITTKSKLENFVDSFDKTHPNYTSSDITEQSGDSLFQSLFLKACLQNNLLENFPLQFSDVGKSSNGSYFAHFTNFDQAAKNPKYYIDLVLPISSSEKDIYSKTKTYYVKNVKVFKPATDIWQYNISLPEGTTHYTIRENGKMKLVFLSLSYVEADITSKE